jgi:hypothetical protein
MPRHHTVSTRNAAYRSGTILVEVRLSLERERTVDEGYLLKLITLSIDLRELQEINEREDEIELFFGESHTPSRIILTGADMKALEKWLDEEWTQYRAHLIAQDIHDVPVQRTKFGTNPDEPDDDTPPPF